MIITIFKLYILYLVEMKIRKSFLLNYFIKIYYLIYFKFMITYHMLKFEISKLL
jgi:hypothetical protein